jgi:hypothetical protein
MEWIELLVLCLLWVGICVIFVVVMGKQMLYMDKMKGHRRDDDEQ